LKDDISYRGIGLFKTLFPADKLSKPQEWVSIVMSELLRQDNNLAWDNPCLAVLARLAKSHGSELVWDAHLTSLFALFLKALDLPIGTADSVKLEKARTPSEYSVLLSGSRSEIIGKLIAYMIPEDDVSISLVYRHLTHLFKIMSSYCHPSNYGKWSPLLIRFQMSIVTHLSKRHKRFTSRRLSEDSLATIAKLMYPTLEWCLFSKNPMVVLVAAQAVQQLAALSPDEILPRILEEKISPSLDPSNLTAPHQVVSTMGVLTKLAGPLVDPNVLPDGPQWLASLLNLALPGIDINDPTKCYLTTLFYRHTISRVKLICKPSEAVDVPIDLLPLTEVLPEWSKLLVKQIFHLFSLGAPDNGGGMYLGVMPPSAAIAGLLDTLYQQLSPALFEEHLDLAHELVQSNATPETKDEVGGVLGALTLANPEATLKKFIPELHQRVVVDPRGDSDLEWCLALAAGLVERGGNAVLPYNEMLQAMIQATVGVEKRSVREGGGELLTTLIEGLSTVWPIECKGSGNMNKDSEITESVSWHIPSEAEISLCHKLVEAFTLPALDKLEAVVKGHARMASGGLAKLEDHIELLRFIFDGARMLGGIPTDTLTLPDDGDETSNVAYLVRNLEVGCHDAVGIGIGESSSQQAAYTSLRLRIVEVIKPLALQMMEGRGEAPKALEALGKLAHELLDGRLRRRGSKAVKLQYVSLKYAAQDLHLSKKYLPRELMVLKTYSQYLSQHEQCVRCLPLYPGTIITANPNPNPNPNHKSNYR